MPHWSVTYSKYCCSILQHWYYFAVFSHFTFKKTHSSLNRHRYFSFTFSAIIVFLSNIHRPVFIWSITIVSTSWGKNVLIWAQLTELVHISGQEHQPKHTICKATTIQTISESYITMKKRKLNSMVWVRERTIPTKRPPLVGEVIANFCG
jgi:hypothetical protein